MSLVVRMVGVMGMIIEGGWKEKEKGCCIQFWGILAMCIPST
jgi:hypothetical protein